MPPRLGWWLVMCCAHSAVFLYHADHTDWGGGALLAPWGPGQGLESGEAQGCLVPF